MHTLLPCCSGSFSQTEYKRSAVTCSGRIPNCRHARAAALPTWQDTKLHALQQWQVLSKGRANMQQQQQQQQQSKMYTRRALKVFKGENNFTSICSNFRHPYGQFVKYKIHLLDCCLQSLCKHTTFSAIN
jgi:hypothetical protein